MANDAEGIESTISSGDWNLDAASARKQKGFPALDYLLWAEDEAQTEAALADTSREQYVTDLITDLKTNIDQVVAAWEGGYADNFNAKDGVDAGSGVSLLINNFIFAWEFNRRHKLGDPIGVRNLGQIEPERGEAIYSRIGKQLALTNAQAIHRVFKGETPEGTNGQGFDDYLTTLDAQHTDGPLADVINAQFEESITKLEAINGSIYDIAQTDKSQIEAPYDAMQRNIVYLKTDMTSALGVAITYSDADGD